MAQKRKTSDTNFAAALQRLSAGGALAHTPSRGGVLVMLGEDRGVLVSFHRGRLRMRAFAPRDAKIEFVPLEEQPLGATRGKKRC